MRILLAEDEPKVAEHVRTGLVSEGYAVDVAVDGDEAIWLAESNSYDALLLDINMPHRTASRSSACCGARTSCRR